MCRLPSSADVKSAAFDNPPEARFCAQCATALDGQAGQPSKATSGATPPGIRVAVENSEPPAIDGERKTVTALFADIKGSTELEQDLDPEEARAIVDPALKLMIAAVHRYDGHVVQSTGDGIFAMFGAPLAHEDHPQRALYAGLRMQEELLTIWFEATGRRARTDRDSRRRKYRRSRGPLDRYRRRAG